MMIDETLQSFCESPYRRLIVTVVTFVVGLVLVLPLVDLYSAECSERESLSAELVSARHITAGLEQFEVRVADQVANLQAKEEHTVREESVAALRNKLVEMARETGCSLRRIHVSPSKRRPWFQNDNLTLQGHDPNQHQEKTDFILEMHPINLSLSGPIMSLRSLLEQMEAQQMLMHTKKLDLRPEGQGRKNLTLDMEVWYFSLSRDGSSA